MGSGRESIYIDNDMHGLYVVILKSIVNFLHFAVWYGFDWAKILLPLPDEDSHDSRGYLQKHSSWRELQLSTEYLSFSFY